MNVQNAFKNTTDYLIEMVDFMMSSRSYVFPGV